jgi:DNA-binding MarR family transcriptional regulator
VKSTKVVAPARLRGLPTWLLSQVALRAQRLVTDAFADADASRSQYSLLAALEEFGPTSQAALGRRLGIDRSDVVALLRELEKRKLVKRAADPSDSRRNVITITRAGVRRLEKLDSLVAEVQAAVLTPLTARERNQLIRLLTRVIDHPTTVDSD